MTIAAGGLPQGLINRLQAFAAEHDFSELYRRYDWRRDNWRAGFPDILMLEQRLAARAKSNLVAEDDVVAVAKWGGYRNLGRIQCPGSLRLPFYDELGGAHAALATDPAALATQLRRATKGLGPTNLSKVLRFAVPSELAAIDSRIVRAVGRGDEDSRREDWLSLRVRNYGYGWYIPLPQPAWPSDYSKWINIVRFFVALLNDSGVACPHPSAFVSNGLRTPGVWACADVEMALFAWASRCLKTKGPRC